MTDTTILHIGAGTGAELESYLATDAARIILVEPNPVLADNLRRRSAGEPRVLVQELAITDQPSNNQWVEYNLPEANSLANPSGLRQFFPGLRALNQMPVATQTIVELIKSLNITGDNNLLVIQAPGAERGIIQGLIEQGSLERFSSLHLTTNHEACYEGSAPAEQLLAELHAHGYESQPLDTNPDWPQWELKSNPLNAKIKALKLEKDALTQSLQSARSELQFAHANLAQKSKELESASHDIEQQQKHWAEQKTSMERRLVQTQQQLEAAQSQLAQIQQQLTQVEESRKKRVSELKADIEQKAQQLTTVEQEKVSLQSALQATNTERDTITNQLAELVQQNQQTGEELKKHKEWLNNRKKEQEATQADLVAANKKAEAAEQRAKTLEAQLNTDSNSQKELAELKKRMEYLFGQTSLQLEQAANALGRHVTTTAKTTAKELEAGIALQQQYGGDLPELEGQNTKLPATVALAISRQLKTQPYDLIIEFGSGVTTSFMAHTLRNQNGQRNNGDKSSETQVSRYIDPSEDDLPKRIVCFEHNRNTYNQLQDTLKASGLAPLISLQFSPLVPYNYLGQEHLFYDCASRLQQIARLFEDRQARIFILVNQPGDGSQPELLAALPQVLQYLSAHTLDVVMNTQGRADVVGYWQGVLKDRELEFSVEKDFGSAHTEIIRINP